MDRPAEVPQALWTLTKKRCTAQAKGKHVSLYNAMHVKRDLLAHLPESAAFEAYCSLMRLDPATHALRRMPLASLCEALDTGPEPPSILNAGGEIRCHRAPQVYGPGRVPELRNTGRRILAGWLAQVTVYARSAFVRQGERLLKDFQGAEVTALPEEMAFDPVVFRRTDARSVAFIEDSDVARRRHVPVALSLLGINTVSFGHWMIEHLPRFLAARDALGATLRAPDGRPVPVLIDADMPKQHLESLRFFGQGGGPEIIRIPRGTRVEVDRLYTVLDWSYPPHLITTDRGLDVAALQSVSERIGQTYAGVNGFVRKRVAKGTVPVPPQVVASRRLFWARKPTRHRAIENWEALRDRLESLGYVTMFPEEMGFARQVATMRTADRIVVQNGSGSLGLFLARPGTRLLYLSHPDLSRFSLQAEAFGCAGLDVRVLSGPITSEGTRWADQSNYKIDPGCAEEALAWLEEGLAPAPVYPETLLPDPDASGPEFPTPLPAEVETRLTRLAAKLRAEEGRSHWTDLQLKSLLAEHCSAEAAQARYIEALGAEGRITMTVLPVCGLLDRLQAQGRRVEIRDAPDRPVKAHVAQIVGPGEALDLARVPRVVAGGWLENAEVFSRSGTILHGDTLLFDRQGTEAGALPQSLGSDTVLFGAGPDPETGRGPSSAVYINESRPDRHLAFGTAWSLMSQNATAFGHWTYENLPNFLTWFGRPDLAGVPILVDATMPVQHRQSLALMLEGQNPIVMVPPGGRVHVGQLFACTGWTYMPHLMSVDPLRTSGEAADFNVFASNAPGISAQLNKLSARVDKRPAPAEAEVADKLYLVRGADQYRRLTNDAEIRALLEARGYAVLRPEELNFAEQVRRVRSAREIVCQAGSAVNLALFARPGTRLAVLYHPGIRTVAAVTSLIEAAGVDLTMVIGAFAPRPGQAPGFADRSDYVIPPERLRQVLDAWPAETALSRSPA